MTAACGGEAGGSQVSAWPPFFPHHVGLAPGVRETFRVRMRGVVTGAFRMQRAVLNFEDLGPMTCDLGYFLPQNDS